MVSRRGKPRASPASRAAVAVEWRGGVHIRGTPIWCDATRTREACFVSSALMRATRHHRQIIASDETLALLAGGAASAGGRRSPRALAVPFGRSFTLGDARLELFRSGAMVGAASLHVDVDGTRVVFAGSVDARGGRLGGAAELRVCDVLVVDATFGHPRFVFPPVAEVLAALSAWVDRTLASGARPVVLTSPLALGPDIVAALAPARPVRAASPLAEIVRRLRPLGHDLPAVGRFTGKEKLGEGEVLIWPALRREAAAIKLLEGARLALVSGWACDRDAVERLRVDAAFPLGEQADHQALLGYILATGATMVHLLAGGGREAELCAALAARGVRAQRLGPHEQLRLL